MSFPEKRGISYLTSFYELLVHVILSLWFIMQLWMKHLEQSSWPGLWEYCWCLILGNKSLEVIEEPEVLHHLPAIGFLNGFGWNNANVKLSRGVTKLVTYPQRREIWHQHKGLLTKLGSLLHPHGLEEAHVVHQPGPGHLEEFPCHLTICYVLTNSPYMPNFGSLLHPHGLEEAPVVHQPGPRHLVDVWRPHHWLL